MVLDRSGTMTDHWWLRPGWTASSQFVTFHVTFDGCVGLHDAATAYGAQLALIGGLDVVPLPWLHLTVQGVGFTGEVSDGEVAALAEAARSRLTHFVPFEVNFRRPEVHEQGITLDAGPAEPLARVRLALRDATADVLGSVAGGDGDFWPHVSLAYANGPVPAAQASDALERADAGEAGPIRARIECVDLIRLRRDGHLYAWSTLARVPLGGPGPA